MGPAARSPAGILEESRDRRYAVGLKMEDIILRVGLIVPPGFQLVSFAPLSVFEIANTVLDEPLYDVRILSEAGGRIPNMFGMEIDTARMGDTAFDTLLVGAPPEVRPSTPGLVTALHAAIKNSRRIASISIGSFTLAEAGLLDGRRATTHWAFAKDLKERFPKVTVEMDSIFIADGPIWTSAGMMAGIDLALGLIERDIGAEKARATARTLLVDHRRAGGQSQHSALLEMDAKSDRVQDSLSFARRNLRARLSVADLADAARLSPRQFSRVFHAETGLAPAKAVETSPARSCKIDARAGAASH